MKNQPLSDFSYEISKPAADPREATIIKNNIKAEFTLLEFYADKTRLEKMLTENEGQLKLSGAKMQNVAQHHPSVIGLTDVQLIAAAIYYEQKIEVRKCTENITKLKEGLAQIDEEIAHIHQCLGFPTREELEKADAEKAAEENKAAETPVAQATPPVEPVLSTIQQEDIQPDAPQTP